MKLNEILGKRAKLVEGARKIQDLADKEERDLSAEELTKYEAIMGEVDEMREQVDAAKAEEKRRKDLDAIMADLEKPIDDDKPIPEGRETQDYEVTRRALSSFFIRGDKITSDEKRALAMDPDTAGGFTVLPEQFITELIQDAKNTVVMRSLARAFSVTKAESMGAPSLDNDVADPTWTAEILTGDEDSTMSFGKRDLYPHPLAKRIKVSKKLLRASALPVDSIVRERLSYKTNVVEENAFLNGDGSNEPLGVFTASANGINTGQDVSTDNTATVLKADNLIECKYTLNEAYIGNARWIFHRDVIKKIRKMKDGEGNYIWRAGLATDKPDTILDTPFVTSAYAPNTFTSGEYLGIIGDFRYYWIVDALNMEIQVLTELYAETNQNGYILRKETDGMPILEEAFVRVTLA